MLGVIRFWARLAAGILIALILGVVAFVGWCLLHLISPRALLLDLIARWRREVRQERERFEAEAKRASKVRPVMDGLGGPKAS